MKVVSIQSTYQTRIRCLLILFLVSSQSITEAFTTLFPSISSARTRGSAFTSSGQFAHHSKYYLNKSPKSKPLHVPCQFQTIVSSNQYRHRHRLMMIINDDKSEITASPSTAENEVLATQESDVVATESTKEELKDDEPILKENEINENQEVESPIDNVDIEEKEMQEKVSMSDLLANSASTMTKSAEELLNDAGSRNGDTTKVNPSNSFELSPPLSFSKYLTMQVHLEMYLYMCIYLSIHTSFFRVSYAILEKYVHYLNIYP